jgi:hypothetical protein
MSDPFVRMGRGMTVLFWLLVLGGGTLLFSGVLGGDSDPGRVEAVDQFGGLGFQVNVRAVTELAEQ